ncbi:MAG: NAD(P)/FAD-dependent oxidoreductase, partial [Oscillospiraceae bacterium]|nr:NAD(P)/FAD-dependent oxidoreductase [Oscillospiraceae bacterium]
MYDTVIIGGGVVGCAVARFLSRFRGSFCLLERENDVCCGTSKANSAIIHAGFDAKAGTLMAKYNVLGSRMMPELARELDIPFRRNGSLVLCMDRADLPRLEALYENGLQNGVEGLEIIDARRLHEMEPNVSRSAVAALWAPTGGIVCPFGMTVALGENAIQNGVEFRLGTRVTQVRPGEKGTWLVVTEKEILAARTVVNAAGVYSGVLHNMVSKDKIHITPRRGEYLLLDKSAGETVHSTVFQLPGVLGKGVLVTPTIHGNLLIGPTAQDTEDF